MFKEGEKERETERERRDEREKGERERATGNAADPALPAALGVPLAKAHLSQLMHRWLPLINAGEIYFTARTKTQS